MSENDPAFAASFPITDESSLHLALKHRALRQGEPFIVVLNSEQRLLSAEGDWLGGKIRFASDGFRLIALAAIDRNCSPGTHELRIRVRFADGTQAIVSEHIEIGATSFPRQELSVDPRFVGLSKEDLERVQRESALLSKVYAASAPERLWRDAFVKPAEARWSAQFGVSRTFNGEERSYHRGADLAVPAGTQVRCTNSGRVVLARDLFFGGNTVIVDHGLGAFTGYMHLSEIGVAEGQEVQAGDPVGLSGATGRVTGPHLHWMLRVNGVVCDPSALLEIEIE